MNTTTITIDKELKKHLDRLKKHVRESYNDVLQRMLAGSQKQNIDVESLQETTEILSDPSIMKSLARSVDDLKRSRLHRLEQV